MFVLYTKPNCPYCEKAKLLLANRKQEFKVLTLDIHFTREELLAKFPSARTYPQIVEDMNYIGGYEDLEKYLKGKNDA